MFIFSEDLWISNLYEGLKPMKILNPINYTFQQLSFKCLACWVDVISRGRLFAKTVIKKILCCLQWPGSAAGRCCMLSCIPELSDVGIQQWHWSWLSLWQTLPTLLCYKLIGPRNYGSILPNICTMPMPGWAHKLLFCTPRILLALCLLLFFSLNRESRVLSWFLFVPLTEEWEFLSRYFP